MSLKIIWIINSIIDLVYLAFIFLMFYIKDFSYMTKRSFGEIILELSQAPLSYTLPILFAIISIVVFQYQMYHENQNGIEKISGKTMTLSFINIALMIFSVLKFMI